MANFQSFHFSQGKYTYVKDQIEEKITINFVYEYHQLNKYVACVLQYNVKFSHPLMDLLDMTNTYLHISETNIKKCFIES